MKKYVVNTGVFILILGIILINFSIAEAQDASEFTVPLSNPANRGKLKARLNSGSITIRGTARKDILVKYASHGRETEADDAERNGLKRLPGGTLNLEVTENNNNVVIKSDSWNNKLDLDIEVPAAFDLQVHTYNNGDLTIQNVQGLVELTNFNGRIDAANVSGSVIATTYNGGIKVSFETVAANTPMSFSTFSGDIDLTFPADLKASLKMKTEQGEVYSGFDVDLTNKKPVRTEESKAGTFKVVIDEWMEADVNGGGAEFTMKNYNGDIYIRRK
jgi:DUF4097 and DUF4098 domain-containing protein YvlB